MSTRRRQLLQASAALSALPWFTNSHAQNAGNASAEFAKSLQERVEQEGVGLAAAVIDDKQVAFHAAGVRTAGEAGAVDADTLFEYGSITKTFTSLLLADMVVRNEIGLNDPVEAVLPDGLKLRDNKQAPIQWADLATHRSGLPRLPANMPEASSDEPYASYSRERMWEFLRAWRPERERDASWEYSNLGAGVLAEALSLRAAKRYDALLQERVLQPLGLQTMTLAMRGKTIDGLARGHNANRKPVTNWRFDALAGAGAMVGSARSLARYAQAALGAFDHPLKEAFALTMQRRAGGPNTINPMGLAWLIAPLDGRSLVTHDGATAGFSSSLVIDPKRKRAALVLANAQVVVNDLAIHLLEPRMPLRNVAAEKKQTQRDAAAVPADKLAALPGTYALNPQFKIVIRAKDGKLTAQATGQGEFELFAIDARKFFAKVTPLEMLFEGDAGAPPALLLHQGGQKLRFIRE
jgi:serine-type D-Ala-D-Ala carboxypeptidase/endopeptidase